VKERELTFKGRVIRCIYDSKDYKVYALDVNEKEYPDVKRTKYGNVSVVGELHDLGIGIEYEVKGTEKRDKNGISYKVLNIRRDRPKTAEEMYIFLQKILTQNQSKVLYDVYPDIVERVMENRLSDIDLSKLHGIKEYTFNVIKNKIEENFCLAELVVEFKGLLSMSIIKKIHNKYPSVNALKAKLRENPYKCLCGLAGVGFVTADSLLLEIEKATPEIIKFEEDLRTSKQRCVASLIYLLEDNESNGHTKMNIVDLRKGCMKLVPACFDYFTNAMKHKDIFYDIETMEVALKRTYMTEHFIAKTIRENITNDSNWWDFDVKKYRIIEECELSDEQIQIVDNICKYNICILNGAAGTGKSFSTQAVINMLKEHNKSFKLFSPTGKAAKVLSDYTKEDATTIHRGLHYIPPGIWGFNKDNEIHTDVLIIDEFSMADIFLFKRVVDAVDFKRTKLLMIGDNAQLPSVSCGNLFHDFMESKIIPTVTLTKVFRYGEGGLMKVATDVRFCEPYLSKDMSKQFTKFGANKDYAFLDVPSDMITKNIVALYKKLLHDYSAEDIQVLTAQNKGKCGTVKLNNEIQKVANPNFGSDVSMKCGDTTYYEGDLIIQKINNYKAVVVSEDGREEISPINSECETAFVANGETGIVRQIFDSYMFIEFDDVLVKYFRGDLNMVGLGYSISIHKSQGSGIKIVILCTPQDHIYMLNSNLIYVGLTRMKERCYHLGSLSAVNKAVTQKANLTRHTFMQRLLIDLPECDYINFEEEDGVGLKKVFDVQDKFISSACSEDENNWEVHPF